MHRPAGARMRAPDIQATNASCAGRQSHVQPPLL